MKTASLGRTSRPLYVGMVLWAFLWGVQGAAQELYAPAPPPDAAFVRVVHAAQDLAEVTPEVGESTFDAIAFGSVTPYQVVSQGERTLLAGALEETLEVSAGRFYTVALTDEGALLLEDPTLDNSARALLTLYNLSDLAAVDLRTADGETEVIAGVAPGASASIDVNPITTAFGVFEADVPIATFDEVALQRGGVYSAFVFGPADAPSGLFEVNTTQTLE
ncbi:alginate O-acetyltransferase AlgF [Truepera radiovictrix]|uniref:Alginate biosynthesis protein AlgF n=1 Tax=Truepera radiovictrix (strain DSM 17093 / CIP 108686 / LMG 22925 / RQ-24) TaxID=649638 RepID=D7CVM1_TRURR|nr:alginate O-acetyltransferase AlgF [Truepera radiovictrix]ADI15932.1 hypothetical protein Trad_2831 [Truepera radiovictrix DSM 17093]WMT58441.1 alginate O-acetyltransferase AlgF [Truepera radiovictrix]